ncbi:MAG: PilZ domain-containing protein [Gammaproteobacteria bacterium]|nr:PilZ domain-containing protein [Gammaproteobacteria bacterium]
MIQETEDKRRFSRIPFQSKIRLSNEKGEWFSQLLDISLKGALIKLPDNWNGAAGDQLEVEITLDASEITISMSASVAHIENDHIGLSCNHIDIDSISHLRRLVELNIGDPEVLQRELFELISHD